MTQRRWWEGRAFLGCALLLSVVPLLWPAVPPLNDLPGHIGRYHVASAIGESPMLQRYWRFEWALIDNLGVDLLVYPLTGWLGAERAVKLVVILIPPLFVAGLAALARVTDRRLSPAAACAFPLAYAYPFQLGFVNFALAASLAILALALWIRLAERIWLRAAIFVPIAWILWIAHSFGWGLFGLMAFASDCMLRRGRGDDWPRAIVGAGLACLALATPVAAMVAAPGGVGDLGWDWKAKAVWFAALLRDRWKAFDVASAIVLFAVLWTAVRQRQWRFEPVVGAAAAIALLAFMLLPRLAFGGAYVDMRMLAPALALAMVAIRIDDPAIAGRVALAATAFLVARTIATTISFDLYAQVQTEALAVVEHIPRGAAVLVLVDEPCHSDWHSNRLGHVAGIAIARRDIFENGQWGIAGQQLIAPTPAIDPRFRNDPSQLVYPAHCEAVVTDFGDAVRTFDRGLFTYVWTIGFPPRSALAPDTGLVFANRQSALYRVAPERGQRALSGPAFRP